MILQHIQGLHRLFVKPIGGADMTPPKRKPVKILNPRYAGATSEMVGKALLRHQPKAATGRKSQDKTGKTAARSSI